MDETTTPATPATPAPTPVEPTQLQLLSSTGILVKIARPHLGGLN